MRLTATTTTFVATIIAALSLTSSVHAEEFWSEKDVPIVPQTFKITNLLRTLDLSKPIIREITSAAIQNTHADQDQTDYYFPVDQAYSDNLAFISAENRKTKEALEVTKDEQFYDAYASSFSRFLCYWIDRSLHVLVGVVIAITASLN